MFERTRQGSAWVEITRPMRELMHVYADGALERLESYGMDDRRESAYALILASAAPLIGLILLGWEPAGVVFVLLINLLIGLTDDIIKVIRSRSSWSDMLHACAEDEYVWRVARSLARGGTIVYGKLLSTPEQIERGQTQSVLWFAALMAYLVAGLCVLFLKGYGAVGGSGSEAFLGSVPSLLMALLLSAFHAVNHHPHWRMAGSTRMQTSAHTAFFIAAMTAIPFFVLTLQNTPPGSDRKLAYVLSFATLGYGLYRVWALRGLQYTARWLQRSMEQNVQHNRNSSSVSGHTPPAKPGRDELQK